MKNYKDSEKSINIPVTC